MGHRSALARPCPRNIVRPWRSTTARSPAGGGRSNEEHRVSLSAWRRHGARRVALVASCAVALVVAGTLAATLGYAQWRRFHQEPNAEYDGKFTFVRLSYTVH